MNFRTFAASVCGTSHRKKGHCCQDHSGVLEFDNIKAIAVADGHGGSDYFLSDVGAKFAVEAAFNQLKIFCNQVSPSERLSPNGIQNFKFSIKAEWLQSVYKDWNERKDKITINEGHVPVVYGTTLLCAVFIGSQILIVQIGDGSCVVLFDNGEFAIPVPGDEVNFLNVTSSLCDEHVMKKFRHVVLDCDASISPVAALMSTDGLDGCYPIFDNEKFLYRLYNVIIGNIIEHGFEETENELRECFLLGMSERASQDDISFAYMVTEDISLLKTALERRNYAWKEFI